MQDHSTEQLQAGLQASVAQCQLLRVATACGTVRGIDVTMDPLHVPLLSFFRPDMVTSKDDAYLLTWDIQRVASLAAVLLTPSRRAPPDLIRDAMGP